MKEILKTVATVTLSVAAILTFSYGVRSYYREPGSELGRRLHCIGEQGQTATFDAPKIAVLPDRTYLLTDSAGIKSYVIPPANAFCVIGIPATPSAKKPDIST